MKTTDTKDNKTAYSYIRFSSPIQQWGDSERRQDSLAKEYCERNGLTLSDRKFSDKGVSAWKGKNRRGALGDLLGVVSKGDYLLIEDEDRLSREDPLTAMNLLKEIVEKGISIITLRDGKIITKENFFDLTVFLPVIVKSTLSNQEDLKKSFRLKQAWKKRRETILNGGDGFGKLPFWLKRNSITKKIEKVPDAVKVVQWIYDLHLKGYGIRSIIETLTKDNTPTFTTSLSEKGKWNTSKIQNILKSPTVYGGFINHQKNKDGKREPVGELIENVLPVVIPKEKYLEVQDKTQSRPKFRGRYDGEKVNNLFSGLMKCSHCGQSIIYSKKGHKGYLTCSNFHFNHLCKAGVLNSMVVEKMIIKFITSRLSLMGRLEVKDKGKNRKLILKKSELSKVKQSINLLSETALSSGLPKSLLEKLTTLETQEEIISQEINRLETDLRELNRQSSEYEIIRQKISLYSLNRVELREKLRTIIREMSVDVGNKSFSIVWFNGRKDHFQLGYQFKGCRPAMWECNVTIGDPIYPPVIYGPTTIKDI